MDTQSPDYESKNDNNAFIVITFLSFAVLSFLIWLIYFKPGAQPEGGTWIDSLPVINAILNTLTSIFLINGFIYIKKNRIDLHKKAMLSATGTSALFLIGYITYHHFHGDTKFIATGFIRTFYFSILISHILLSAIQVPLILSTLYLAFTKNFIKHKKIAKITFPIWLYVSVTGVIVFAVLRWFNT